MWYDNLIDSGAIPDFLLKTGVRLTFGIKKKERNISPEERQAYIMNFVKTLKNQPAALKTADTKRQHYEVPTEFFKIVLGSQMKYSCCLWDSFKIPCTADRSLDKAEQEMLDLTTARAGIENRMSILELGCGWGSLSLFMARKYPDSKITAVSHSKTQKEWIDSCAQKFEINNLKVITADINDFHTDEKYDRIVSVEMFEHMRNYDMLFRQISSYLNPGGKVFIHIFTIDGLPYFFNSDSDNDWMGRNFFAGGIMPSTDLVLYFADYLAVEDVWKVDGRHYQKTLLAWLYRMDRHKTEIMPVFKSVYGKDASKWWNRWRLFFLSCSVVFSHNKGKVWNVTHYLLHKK